MMPVAAPTRRSRHDRARHRASPPPPPPPRAIDRAAGTDLDATSLTAAHGLTGFALGLLGCQIYAWLTGAPGVGVMLGWQ